MKLKYKDKERVRNSLLRSDFKTYEKEVKPFNFTKKDIVELLYELFDDEIKGITSYLTPRVSIEVLAYLQKAYNLEYKNYPNIYFVAISSTNNKLIDWLLNKGFDINTQNKEGNTLLHIASSIRYAPAYSFNATKSLQKPWELPNSDDPDKVSTILKYHPNLNQKNNNNKTAQEEAQEHGNYRVVKLLIDFSKQYSQ